MRTRRPNGPLLDLEDYRALVHLDAPYPKSFDKALTDSERAAIIDDLLDYLLNSEGMKIPENLQVPIDKRLLLRALLNIREPEPLPDAFLKKLDRLLQAEMAEQGIVRPEDVPPCSEQVPAAVVHHADKMALWTGDITRLAADAIVNAANKSLLGCFQPLHACVDNAIHSAAGPQLRQDCYMIMKKQGRDEPTGGAKMTRAYNLPATYVLHTVGPIVPGGRIVADQHRERLAASYRSCLDLASRVRDIRTVAFCAISTGAFGFPKREAARIAVKTVDEWLAKAPARLDRIIFVAYTEEDANAYIDAMRADWQ